MAIAARNFDRLRLPIRSRARRFDTVSDYLKTALTKRVAALPDGGEPVCSIGNDYISVYGLHPTDRHQILSRGWGRLGRHEVLLFLPRDDQELEICWKILSHASSDTFETKSARPGGVATPWSGDLPRFSRTTLQ